MKALLHHHVGAAERCTAGNPTPASTRYSSISHASALQFYGVIPCTQGDRLEDDWVPLEDQRPAEEVEAETRRSEAQHRAVVLEMVGDLPDAGGGLMWGCGMEVYGAYEDVHTCLSPV